MGQNPLDWKVIYIIEKFLELKCLIWAHMTHLAIWNTSYGQKKGRELNWQIKSLKSPWFPCVQVACDIPLESSRRRLQLCLDLISIISFHIKLCAPKVAGIPTLGISRLPLRNPETKCHLCANPVARHRVYYKGEGGGFPQVQVVVNLMNPSLPTGGFSTKSVITMH
jgi:hypothetical protein